MTRTTLTLLLAFTLAACKDKDGVSTDDSLGDDTAAGTDSGDDTDGPVDADGDGYTVDEDCDDTNPSVNPGAAEVCDSLDNNCDGNLDEGATSTWYQDQDGDGWGGVETTQACDKPDGFAEQSGDCRDDDPAYYPGAEENDCADPNDYNCDGSVGYADNDSDGFSACEECDDSSAAVNPGAEEVCDSLDNNCDGGVDEGLLSAYYRDADADGYGDPDYGVEACTQPSGYSSDSSDCDDAIAAINPAASEQCNGFDDDCDTLVDDADDSLDPASATAWYSDTDGDGYGDDGSTGLSCTVPSGAVTQGGDCDDSDAATSPDGAEICDGSDNDCDGDIDSADSSVDSSTGTTYYEDQDSDGYGDASSAVAACDQPSGYTTDASDCDDSDASINPTASEVCDDADNDCDSLIDDSDSSLDTSTATTYYKDADGDTYGDKNNKVKACDRPSGYRANLKDCDDTNASISPAATEICDLIDNDCDSLVDDADSSWDTSTGVSYYTDSDGDGYGDGSVKTACTLPSGAATVGGDCDDSDSGSSPAEVEICDGADNDCDGSVPRLEDDPDADGLLACEEALWLSTDSGNANSPTGGSSTAAGYLTARGITTTATNSSSTTLSSSVLDNYGVLVIYGTGAYGAFSSAEASALEDWVTDGGGLLYMGYHPYASSCTQVNSLPSSFGLSCTSYSTAWAGSTSTFVSHSLTTGLSTIGGAGGEAWVVASPLSTLASVSGYPVLVAGELGDGRIVGVSDEWPYYNGSYGSVSITYANNATMVDNIWAWLLE